MFEPKTGGARLCHVRRTAWRPRTRRALKRRTPIALVALLLAVLAAGCGGSGLTKTAGAPVVTVVTGLWPLAEAATVIGQGNVTVDDVVPAGNDPSTYRLNAAQEARVHRGDIAVEMAGGFQPSFDAAAAGSAHLVQVPQATSAATSSPEPYVWLDPHAMKGVARRIASALEAADPKAIGTFRNGLDNLEAQLDSLDADYQSTLSSCPDTTIVTVNHAFDVLDPYYPVTVRAIEPIGTTAGLPSKATERHEVAAIKATGTKEIYNESWIPGSDIIAATVTTRVKIGTLDTLSGAPSGGWMLSADGSKYVSLMENNLGTIAAALHCPNPGTD